MLIYSYINTRENWKNSKLCENTPPFGRHVSTQFLVFPISTRVDITVYQHGKYFIFFKYHMQFEKVRFSKKIIVRVTYSWISELQWRLQGWACVGICPPPPLPTFFCPPPPRIFSSLDFSF